ncbi:hypothetical protein LTS18_006447, partial [Coniosporium uncinatum]
PERRSNRASPSVDEGAEVSAAVAAFSYSSSSFSAILTAASASAAYHLAYSKSTVSPFQHVHHPHLHLRPDQRLPRPANSGDHRRAPHVPSPSSSPVSPYPIINLHINVHINVHTSIHIISLRLNGRAFTAHNILDASDLERRHCRGVRRALHSDQSATRKHERRGTEGNCCRTEAVGGIDLVGREHKQEGREHRQEGREHRQEKKAA